MQTDSHVEQTHLSANTSANRIVIFGASGDLTRRKLIPALYHLFNHGMLPDNFSIIGVGRTELSNDSFRQHLQQSLPAEPRDQATVSSFCHHVFYLTANPSEAAQLAPLAAGHAQQDSKYPGGNTLYYLATPPALYAPIAQSLFSLGLNRQENNWSRLVVEKPFGHNLASARQLDRELHACFNEKQIYRIDHYLGKETVQNLLVLRFANTIFEPLWNCSMVDFIEITAAESLGVEKRGAFYERTGAVRDMLQNHLLQVLAMVAMEQPATISADVLRDQAVQIMRLFRPLTDEDVRNHLILGQYLASNVRGENLVAYREESGVSAESRTETYVALKMYIDSARWQGVPIYLRTGKRLPTRATEVVLHFKKTLHPSFTGVAPANKLIIRIQPDEGILVSFGLKRPGSGFQVQDVAMDFHYSDLSGAVMPDAYERLLLDALNGDSTLFARSDEVETCWSFIQPILDYLQDPAHTLYGYAAGTWGPQEADQLLATDGHAWRFPCKNLTSTQYCEL
ncbi:MAG: glucose-6-phosphate dehydrogenase [Desulfobulbaceae bacterium]|nr:glucose-6-phosphate dehydrogenase [Desulfobulbaceae bacterium]